MSMSKEKNQVFEALTKAAAAITQEMESQGLLGSNPSYQLKKKATIAAFKGLAAGMLIEKSLSKKGEGDKE